MTKPLSAPTPAPVLITDAPMSYAEQFAARRRRYATVIGLRIPCLLLAGVFYQTWWLALLFIALSLPLPWIAVLIANDTAPRKREDPHLLRRTSARQLEAPGCTVLGGAPAGGSGAHAA